MDFRDQLAKLRLEVEAGKAQVGVGDGNFQRDDQLRAQHAGLVTQERKLLAALGGRSLAAVDALFRRIDAVEANLDGHDALVDKVVDERVQEMQRVLDEERVNLQDYESRIVELNGETEDVVGGIAYQNFRTVEKRFYDLVLKADVGLVDVGWAEREEHRTRVEMLTRERTRLLKALDDEFSEIMDERGKP